MPGDSPRFDLYDGQRESPSLRQKTLEITSERVSESESYEMGLQISCGIYPEAAQESYLRRIAQASLGGIPGVGASQGVGGSRRAFARRSCAHVFEHSAEVRRGQRGGIHEGKERNYHRAT